MELRAKQVTMAVSRYSPKGMARPNASMASDSPCGPLWLKSPASSRATAVSVHTKPESLAGPSMAMSPSLTGSLLADVACMMEAVPTPASLTRAARRAPIMATPASASPSGAEAECLAENRGEHSGTASMSEATM